MFRSLKQKRCCFHIQAKNSNLIGIIIPDTSQKLFEITEWQQFEMERVVEFMLDEEENLVFRYHDEPYRTEKSETQYESLGHLTQTFSYPTMLMLAFSHHAWHACRFVLEEMETQRPAKRRALSAHTTPTVITYTLPHSNSAHLPGEFCRFRKHRVEHRPSAETHL